MLNLLKNIHFLLGIFSYATVIFGAVATKSKNPKLLKISDILTKISNLIKG